MLMTLDELCASMYNIFKHLNERGVGMDPDFRKRYEWFYHTIFQDEDLPVKKASKVRLPSALKAARSLEKGMPRGWQSREALFIKQGKLLADYEDDYEYDQPLTYYYPTYADFSNGELRGYFTWRTKLRQGVTEQTSASYAYLYAYELLNLITVDTPMEAFEKLVAFRDCYGSMDDHILPYMNRWLVDFAVMHNLDPALLDVVPQMELDRQLLVLMSPEDHTQQQVLEAVRTFAPKWLKRSRFYHDHKEDMDRVIPKIIVGIAAHYSRGKRPFVEQLFGSMDEYVIRLFESAVYYRDKTPEHTRYDLNPVCYYERHNHFWTIHRYSISRHCPKLEDFIKTIDGVMRSCYDYGHPIRLESKLQWLQKLIKEETMALLQEKKDAETKKLHIDYSQLETIRRNAEVTRESLLVEEERMEEDPLPLPDVSAAPEQTPEDTPFEPEEYRLLQCLLYGGSLQWVQASGRMVSVLVDSINEKLYDTFMDTVVEAEPPGIIEDYLSDLKEMVKP